MSIGQYILYNAFPFILWTSTYCRCLADLEVAAVVNSFRLSEICICNNDDSLYMIQTNVALKLTMICEVSFM